MLRRSLLALAALLALANVVRADPLSRKTEIDFFRDVPSRNLRGLAARSDGRLVAGPAFVELNGTSPADLLWCLVPGADPSRWLVGTGPDGKIYEVTLDAAKTAFTAREIADLDESHVFALARLPDGSLLAGTSPKGALCLVRDGKVVTRTALPVDSIFDILLLPAAPPAQISNLKSQIAPQAPLQALIATGNPGRIYQIDLAKFAAAPASAEKISDAKPLADRGITLFGEIRDRNLRRLVRLADGRIAAGSAPRGNIYGFSAPSDNPSPLVAGPARAPIILLENRDAEVTDLLPTPDGGLYAALTFSGGSGESRVAPPKAGAKEIAETVITITPLVPERFGGRATLVWLPANGFPETVASRAGTAFYRLAPYGELLLVSGGEQGEMLGYDPRDRLSLTFAGSASSQLNAILPIPGSPDRFLVLRNNAPGFALLDFSAKTPREAETRRLDLSGPAQLGALRFNRLRSLAEADVSAELKTSNGSDEVEGWTAWTPLRPADGAWTAATPPRGRYYKLRLRLPAASPATAELDKAALFTLPQNRRPQLQEFHLLTPNYGLIAMPESPTPPVTSVGQLLQGSGKDDDGKRKSAFMSSQIVPTPGAQVVLWTVNDPDGDNLACTFSIRRDGDTAWTDIAIGARDPYAQFDVAHLADGVYFTRLVVTETDPRPVGQRLSTTFETDDLVVDHSPPQILDATVKRDAELLTVTVRGRDALSLLEGLEVTFNNGVHEQTEQPADGIRDSREETFVMEFPLPRVAGATSVEVTLYDAAGNATARRLTW